MSDERVPIDSERVAERLRAAALPAREDVDAVVALARGGVVPGALVAFHLGRPLRLLRLTFRDDANAPASAAPEALGPVPDVRGRRILIVDDVSVTGATLAQARRLLGADRATTLVVKGPPGAADVVLFPDVPACVRWPWHEDVPPRPAPSEPPRAVVIGGVSGSGKTSVGRALAERLGWDYVEADDHHGAENKAKMARGEPLTDDDRAPWLASLRRAMDASLGDGRPVVVTCSALRRRYRDVLVGGRPDAALVLLHAPEATLAARLGGRSGHFFDPRLLASQLATLELPAPDEDVRVLDATLPSEALVARIVADLGLGVRAGEPRPAPGGSA